MSKKSKSKSTSTETVTSTPVNPSWVTDSATGLQTRINSLLDTDAKTLIPGASNLQTQAFERAAGVGGWAGGNAAAQEAVGGLVGATMTPQQATSRSLLDVDLGAYQNPYLESVLDTTRAGFDERKGMEEAQQRAAAARGQKFSGSRDAIRQAMFDRGVLQDWAGIESGLRKEGFDRATGLATSDLNREAQTSQFNAGQANTMTAAERDAQLRAAGLLGDLSNSQAGNERADLGLLTEMGGVEREIEREELGADVNMLRLISALNSGQPYSLFHGETRTGNATSETKGKEYGLGNALGTIGSLLQGAGNAAGGAAAAAMAFSDKRLKADIQTEGRDRAGRRVVSYRYKGEPKDVRRVGYIAQEIEKSDPEAVVKGPGGYRMVNYGLLGDAA